MVYFSIIKKLGISEYIYGLLPRQGKEYADRMKRKLLIKKLIKNGYPKLNLGSGWNFRWDYINIDKYDPKADVKANICSMPMFREGSVSEILMSHVLDHLPRKYVQTALKECYRVMKGVGRIEVIVQNSEVYLKEWLGGDLDYKRGWGVINIYGHDREGAYHRNAFTKELLEHELREAGFKNIECYVTETRPYTKMNNCFEYRKNGDIKGIGIR